MNCRLKKINHYLCKTPSALAGFALAIASLGLCWENALRLQGSGQMIAAIVASCLLLPLFLKFLFNLHLLQQDLKHHVGGSVAPTIAMATMVIANNIAKSHFQTGQVISLMAIILHLYFLFTFISHRSKNFKFEHILPSWFIPPIGLVLAVMMHPGGVYPQLAALILQFGLLSYAVLLPIVLYRLLFSEKLCDAEKPIIVILATPASLLLLGYFAVTTQPSYLMVAILAPLALFMTLFVYLAFIKLLRLPFTPAYSAFTFPLVVSSSALFKTTQFLLEDGVAMQWVELTRELANIELIIASFMVLYVAFRYIVHFLPRTNQIRVV